MISSEVDPGPREVAAAPEVLSFGPRPPSRQLNRALLVVGVVLAVLAAGYGVWRLLPRPAPDFTLSDLQGVYTGMVRSDGTNDVSTLTRDKLTEPPATITPVECVPLFDSTLSNQFPVPALDGVSTYWLNEGSASISLLTYRYPDTATAQQQFDTIRSALTSCTGAPLTINRKTDIVVTPQDVQPPADTPRYLSYRVTYPLARARFTTDVVQLSNTVSWQYRYDYRSPASYSSLSAQQLMTGLISQMRSVQDAHR